MFKRSSVKYNQDSKEKLQKNLLGRYESFYKEEKGKKQHMGMTDTKFSLTMKSKRWLSVKKYYKMRKKSFAIIN